MQKKYTIGILFLSLMLCVVSALHAQADDSLKLHLEKYKIGEGVTMTNGKGFSTTLNFMIQPWAELRTIENQSESGYRLRIRRLRLRLNGRFSSKFSYRLALDFSQRNGNVEEELLNGSLLDAYVAYDISKNFQIAVGQRSLSTDSRELRFSSNYINLVERSRLVSSFASIRDLGIFVYGRHQLKGRHRMKTYLEIISGDGQSAFIRNYGGLKYGARVDYFPNGYFRDFGQFRGHDLFHEWIPKFALGVYGSYNDGISSRRGRRSGSLIYLDANQNILLPDYAQFGADLAFRYRGWSFLAEYQKAISIITDGIVFFVRDNGTLKDDFEEGIDTWIKERQMLGSIFNVQLGYTFKNGFSLDGRFTKINPATDSFLNNNTFFNRNEYYNFGVTQYFFNNTAKIQFDMVINTTGRDAVGVNETPTNGLREIAYRMIAQIQI